MNVQLKVLIILILPIVKCETSNDAVEEKSEEETQFDIDRFNKDFADEEWHVAHLKQGRRRCVGDTFQDRARRYRKALQNDGSLIKFVSSDSLPVNVSDIVDDDTCKVDIEVLKSWHKNKEEKNASSKTEDNVTSTLTEAAAINDTKRSSAVQNAGNVTSTAGNTVNYQATTPTMKVTDDKSKEEDVEKEQNFKSRRGSEYMFSSVEYYEDVPDFDESLCPDAVDVITLELDEIRSYDVECERTVEWRSLID